MAKNIIKLKESHFNKIVQRIILEQTENDEKITISGSLGNSENNFLELKTFVDNTIEQVNKKLQGDTPYIIRLIQKELGPGISTNNGKNGDNFFMEINFVPVSQEKRYYYFTCAAAIYSEALDFPLLSSEVNEVVRKKRDAWTSGKKYSLGMDLFDLKDFNNLNVTNPEKKYKLLFRYSVGTKPPLDNELPTQQ